MNKKDEALKRGLKRAEALAKEAGEAGNGYLVAQVVEIIAPLREALAEQPAQQQEIEELTTQRDNLADILTRTANVLKGQPAREHIGDSGRVLIQPIGPVVCHQPAAQTDECVVCGDKVRVIPRPWVGLTKEDRYKAIRPLYCDDATAALAACHSNDEYEAIETKLREKNAQPSKPLTDEQEYEAIGTAGNDLLELAKRWADNEVHVYQFDNEARKIIKAVLHRAHAKGDA